MTEFSEDRIFDIALAYQQTAALVAAVKLDIFTAINAKTIALEDLVSKTGASRRGLRILCDYLVVLGLLTKKDSQYSLAPAARIFLDESSPFARGKIVDFVAAPEMLELFFTDPVSYVRKGGSTGLASVSPDHPLWVRFAKAMAPYSAANAKRLAAHVATFSTPPNTVLDIAAGPGLYGIEVAKAVPGALITAIDWTQVLAVAAANAQAAGISDRFRGIAGNAFELEWGTEYDLVLLPNCLHLFDFDACVSLLRKAKRSLAVGGQLLGVDFVPNEDQVSPKIPAMLAFWMLATTPGGDSYTERQLEEMARQAGFRGATTRPLAPAPESLIIFDN